MAFASPVVRDSFLYNGDLFVDVGNLNRHKRASIAEITEVLRPDLKRGKQSAPAKDPVGHWYEAQLIHYGLPPSKDKARAKMRLLENLNKSNLNVPTSITSMEAEMKKEFASAERKAKAQLKAASTENNVTPKSVSKAKRKNPDSTAWSPDINVSINIGLDSPGQNSAPAKKRKLQTAKRGGMQSSPAPRNQQTAQQHEVSHNQPTSVSNVAPSPKPRPKQTARRGGFQPSYSRPAVLQSDMMMSNTHSHPSYDLSGMNTGISHPVSPQKEVGMKESKPKVKKEQVKNEPTIKKNSKPRIKKEQDQNEPAIKNQPKPRIKKEAAVKKEPKPKKEQAIKHEQIPKSRPTAAHPSLGLINGICDITCPEVKRNSDNDPLTLVLTLDTPGVWGAYDFGIFTGIIHIPDRPRGASDEPLHFNWRGRCGEEGEMEFGEDCCGQISFLGNGRIKGWISVYGQCSFEGARRPGPDAPIRPASSMREEWDGYNEREYERERVGRWGGWSY